MIMANQVATGRILPFVPPWSARSMLSLSLALLVRSSLAIYESCSSDVTGAYMACQPGLYELNWYPTFKLTLDPINATCGTPLTTYRRLGDWSGLVEICDAASAILQHPPSFMVDTNTSSWWQSVNQPANSQDLRVNVTLSYNKTFILGSDIVITFNSGRPDQMVLEKSMDYGITWSPLQFYARNCSVFSANLIPGAAVTEATPTAVTCTNRYVETATKPSVGQKLKLAVDDRIHLFLGQNDVNFPKFYMAMDTMLLPFLKFTDLRLSLRRPATGVRTSSDSSYYGISDIEMTAWCDCNLHAAYCNYTETAVICDCQHNTAGPNCELCEPLYNERPWQTGLYLPTYTGTANECLKCECNDHAISCVYNATYGRGVCQNCSHNTRGYHCELCTLTFYPNITLPLSDANRCVVCDCDPMGVFNNSMDCSQADSSSDMIGQCPCRAMIAGRRCDQCVPGFYGLKDGPTPGNCTACGCNLDGTVGQSNTCQQSGGQCPCKEHIVGRNCSSCADGYYSFPTGTPQQDCLVCSCDVGGSKDQVCNKTNGQCTCRQGITGVKCNQVMAGNYVPALDSLKLEPVSGGNCEVASDRLSPESLFDGPGFATCNMSSGGKISLTFQPVLGGMVQKNEQWPYLLAVRYSTGSSNVTGTLTVQVTGNTAQDLTALSSKLGHTISSICPLNVGTSQSVPMALLSGISMATISMSNNISLDVRCQYRLTLELSFTAGPVNSQSNVTTAGNGTTPSGTVPNGTTAGNGTTPSGTVPNGTTSRRKREAVTATSTINIDSVVLLPSLSNSDGSMQYQIYNRSDNQTVTNENYLSCLQKLSALSQRQMALTQTPCTELMFAVGTELNDGALACACNSNNSDPTLLQTCQSLGGQCYCKQGVSGRTCDSCTPGYYNMTSAGCTPCPVLPCDIPMTTTEPPATTQPPPTTVTTNHSNDYNSTVTPPCLGPSLSGGIIAVIVVIVVIVVLLVVALVVIGILCWRIKKMKQKQLSDSHGRPLHSSGYQINNKRMQQLPTDNETEFTNTNLTRTMSIHDDDNMRNSHGSNSEMLPITLDKITHVDLYRSRARAFQEPVDNPLSHSSPKETKQSFQRSSFSGSPGHGSTPQFNEVNNLYNARNIELPESRSQQPQRKVRSSSLDGPWSKHKDLFEISDLPDRGLNLWSPIDDLRLSDADDDQEVFEPFESARQNNNVAGKTPYKENVGQKLKKESPQKPKRHKLQDVAIKNILAPPSMHDGVSPSDLDYDTMSDSTVLIPQPSKGVMRGYSNPVFVPEPDYPTFAGPNSFDEINGSFV